jgi:hypothetical protein
VGVIVAINVGLGVFFFGVLALLRRLAIADERHVAGELLACLGEAVTGVDAPPDLTPDPLRHRR